jgi:hypothetical protein
VLDDNGYEPVEVIAEVVPMPELLRIRAATLIADLPAAQGHELVESALLESAAILKDAANQLGAPEADLEP